ncbi:hypothetical protein CGZ93_04150 [Enemella dayhoffiae]|uniref:DUF218 domain-containing protein n=1 Tax=Enemella dayhoffiae TaxID=2016507 RepID=A0A255H9H8_9ACTN|nr:YdcF family protein [Enemella dayhoffiae]OYO24301.1 hypothetical protein CGZ93_04150 [Enemella dayhoffiae]
MPAVSRKPVDALVVLGNALHGGRVMPVLERRLEASVARLRDEQRRGNEPVLVLSGGRARPGRPSEAAAMRDWLLEHGLEWERTVLEDRSVNTWQNLQFSRPLIAGSAHVLIISSDYHLPRVRLMLRLLGWRAATAAAPTPRATLVPALLRELVAFPALLLPGQRTPGA